MDVRAAGAMRHARRWVALEKMGIVQIAAGGKLGRMLELIASFGDAESGRDTRALIV